MAALSQAYVHHDGTVYGRVTETGVPSTNIEFQLTTLGSHFALSWRTLRDHGLPDHGQIITDGGMGHVVVYMSDSPKPFLEKDGSSEIMLAMAQGLSGGCAMLLHDLWSGNLEGDLPQPPLTVTTGADGVVVSGSSRIGGTSQWILHPRHVLECRDEMKNAAKLLGSFDFGKLSDDQIKDALDADGMPVTAQSIANMRSMMAMGQNAIANGALPTVTTTILSDVPLQPLPETAAPPKVVTARPKRDPPMDLTLLTHTVASARALGTTALGSHDVQTLMAAQHVVLTADMAIMNYYSAAIDRGDMHGEDVMTALDERGLSALQEQLGKLLITTLQASLPPGSIKTPDASP